MQKNIFQRPALVLAVALLAFSSCKKHSHDDSTAQETITRVIFHFTGDGFDQEFTVSDADGEGGNPPTIPTIELPLNKTLNCHIHVWDDTQNPVHDLTHQIEDEGVDHLWTFSQLGTLLLDISYADADANGKPIGLESTWKTSTFSAGVVKVSLFHEPSDKANLETPGGETDFSVEIPVQVK